jgi:hypothetical protein
MENKKYLRVIDVNLNRSREGLRVIEDTARLVLESAGMYKKVRSLRHKLDKITRSSYPELLKMRQSQKDSGRKIKEGKRSGIYSVLAANFRRAEESLRVLEEYSKFLSSNSGAGFKKIRFEVYTLEKKLMRTLTADKK